MTHGRCRSLVALALALGVGTSACGGQGRSSTVLDLDPVTTSTSSTTTVPPTTTTVAPTTLPPTTTTTIPTADSIARSVVLVLAMDPDDDWCSWGSAVVVSADGLLLTNHHVTVSEDCDVVDFVVAVAPSTNAGAIARYRASLVAADETLDLAVLRVDRELGGQPTAPQLTPALIGDANTLHLTDPVTAFGYPGAGADPDSGEVSISASTGTVIGFLDDRKWIKIDADIEPGNSGGGLFDASGRLVGVPTRGVRGTTFGQARSVNLAAGLIGAATTPPAPPAPPPSPETAPPAEPSTVPPTAPPTTVPPTTAATARFTPSTLAPGAPVPPLPAGFDPATVTVRSVVVSPGKVDGKPAVGPFAPGITQVCVFWRTTGLAEGAPQHGRWYLDGTLVVETWLVRRAGLPAEDYLNWCLPAEAAGPLPSGAYRFVYDVGRRNLIDVRATIG